MSTTNPFRQVRETVTAALGAVSGVNWVADYNGEDFERMRSEAALKGAGCYLRCNEGSGVEGPISADCQELKVHVIIAASAIPQRATPAEAAEQLLWDCYVAIRGTQAPAAVVLRPWKLDQWAVEDQTPTATIISLVVRTHADLGYWQQP